MNILFHVPLALTLTRLIASPIIIPLLFAYFLPAHNPVYNIFLAIVFMLLSITDFFDGYIARKYHQESALGRLLDPIADKFLLYATLISLVYTHKLYFYWAIIFIGREMFIMGLREISSHYHISLSVIQSAKYKTAFQFLYLLVVILNPYQTIATTPAYIWYIFETVLLCLALGFSLFSAYYYYTTFLKGTK